MRVWGIETQGLNKLYLNTPYFLQPVNKIVSLKLLQSEHNDKESVESRENIAFTLKDLDNDKETLRIYTALTSKKSLGFNKLVCKISDLLNLNLSKDISSNI